MRSRGKGRRRSARGGIAVAALLCAVSPALAQQAVPSGRTAAASPLVLDVLDSFAIASAPHRSRVGNDFTAGDARGAAFAPHVTRFDDPAQTDKIDFDLMDDGMLSMTVTGRVIEGADAPVATDARVEPNACANEPSSETCRQTNYDGSVRLAAFDDRVRISGTYSSPGRAHDRARARIDSALGIGTTAPTLRERIDLAPLDRGPLHIATYGEYAQYGPLAGAGDAFIGSDRSRTEFGLELGYASVKLGASGTSYAPGSEDLGTELTSRAREGEVHAEFQLAPLAWEAKPLPSRVGISRSHSRVVPFDFGAWAGDELATWVERQHTTTDALAPSWDWRFGTTGLSLSRTSYKSSLAGATTDSSLGRAVDLKHSIKLGAASASANVGYGVADHYEPVAAAEEKYRAGASLRFGLPGLPDLDARAEVSVSRTAPVDGEPYPTSHWKFASGLDFSKLLPAPLADRAGSLKLSGTLHDADASAVAARDVEGTVALTGKLSF